MVRCIYGMENWILWFCSNCCRNCPLAVGAALSSRIKKNNTVSIAYLGDGAMEEGGA